MVSNTTRCISKLYQDLTNNRTISKAWFSKQLRILHKILKAW
jgi:hypothetical protein